MSCPRRGALRRSRLYVNDAIVHSERVLSYIFGLEITTLPLDTLRMDAVLRNLQIVGEAVKQIPEDLRSTRPEIPWTSIAGMRNILVHHYFRVDADIVLDICENHLQPLLEALKAISTTISESRE